MGGSCMVFSQSKNAYYLLWPNATVNSIRPMLEKNDDDKLNAHLVGKKYPSASTASTVDRTPERQLSTEATVSLKLPGMDFRLLGPPDASVAVAPQVVAVVNRIPMAAAAKMEIEDFHMDHHVFDPDRPQLRASLLKKLQMPDTSNIEMLDDNSGYFNDGVWFVSDPSSTSLALKLVPHQSRRVDRKTDM